MLYKIKKIDDININIKVVFDIDFIRMELYNFNYIYNALIR